MITATKTKTVVRFDCTKYEAGLIREITDRAESLYRQNGMRFPGRLNVMMDLSACHVNGCPLDLKRLLKFSDFDLIHDISGINGHMDSTTGKLRDCFLPRAAKN